MRLTFFEGNRMGAEWPATRPFIYIFFLEAAAGVEGLCNDLAANNYYTLD